MTYSNRDDNYLYPNPDEKTKDFKTDNNEISNLRLILEGLYYILNLVFVLSFPFWLQQEGAI